MPDIKAAQQQLANRSVSITHPPHMIFKHPDGIEEWMAFFNDPDGKPLGIMSQVSLSPEGAQHHVLIGDDWAATSERTAIAIGLAQS